MCHCMCLMENNKEGGKQHSRCDLDRVTGRLRVPGWMFVGTVARPRSLAGKPQVLLSASGVMVMSRSSPDISCCHSVWVVVYVNFFTWLTFYVYQWISGSVAHSPLVSHTVKLIKVFFKSKVSKILWEIALGHFPEIVSIWRLQQEIVSVKLIHRISKIARQHPHSLAVAGKVQCMSESIFSCGGGWTAFGLKISLVCLLPIFIFICLLSFLEIISPHHKPSASMMVIVNSNMLFLIRFISL